MTILPARTPVNLNTARAEVIYAAIAGIDMAAAETIVSQRERTPFRTLPDAAKLLVGTELSAEQHSIKTDFFEVRGRLRTPRGAPSWWSPMNERVLPVTRRDPLDAQLEHFVGLARGGSDPLVTIRDAAETLRVTLAIAAAAHPSLAPELGARR